MLLHKITALGGNPSMQRTSLWKTAEVKATKKDAKASEDIEAGKTYTIWVARKDGFTQKGKPDNAGEWFAVEKE